MTRKVAGLLHAGLLALTMLAGTATLALAQDEPRDEPRDEPSPAETRAAAFESMEGAQTEDVPGGSLLIAAYGTVWLLVLGYVMSLAFRQARTARELEQLRQDVEAAGKGR